MKDSTVAMTGKNITEGLFAKGAESTGLPYAWKLESMGKVNFTQALVFSMERGEEEKNSI